MSVFSSNFLEKVFWDDSVYSGGRLGGSLISTVPVERRNGGNTTKSRRNNTNLVLRLAIVNILIIIILPRACSLPMIQLAGVHLIIAKRWVGLDTANSSRNWVSLDTGVTLVTSLSVMV